MYKVLIVDDEEVVREGIRTKIRWGELGFSPPVTAADGREAMDIADELSPHLVITDIYMPFVDGLELSEYLYANHPDTKIIILSGFDEFDFAVRALKYRASDYILKPVTSAELTDILVKIKGELDAEKERRLEILNIKTLLTENGPVIKERFLNRLINDEARESELIKKLDFIGLPRDAGKYAVALLDVDGGPGADEAFLEYGSELLSFSVCNISEELTAELTENEGAAGIVFQNALSQTVIIFWGDKARAARENICGRIVDLLPRVLGFTVTIGFSGVFSDISEISQRYGDAGNALERRFIMGGNRIIDAERLSGGGAGGLFDSGEHEELIINAVKSGSAEDVSARLGALFSGLKRSGRTMEGCHALIQRLLFQLQLLILRLDLEPEEVFGTQANIITDLYRYKTLDEINGWLTGLCLRVSNYLLGRRESYSKNLAAAAVEYIKENYQNPDMSVNSVSRHLSISPSYFSSIFKAATNETFIGFLTKTRLQKAKELLKTTNLKAYEISDKVGYTDSHYFSILFKKHTGKTPTEYREQG